MKRVYALMAAVTAALVAGAASAADLRVEVTGLRSARGMLLVAVCTPQTFTRAVCPHVATAPASDGAAIVRGIAPGIWAVQAIHDEDGNGTLTRRGFLPDEGVGFSRDAPMRLGPPRFADAAVELKSSGMVVLTMRYFK